MPMPCLMRRCVADGGMSANRTKYSPAMVTRSLFPSGIIKGQRREKETRACWRPGRGCSLAAGLGGLPRGCATCCLTRLGSSSDWDEIGLGETVAGSYSVCVVSLSGSRNQAWVVLSKSHRLVQKELIRLCPDRLQSWMVCTPRIGDCVSPLGLWNQRALQPPTAKAAASSQTRHSHSHSHPPQLHLHPPKHAQHASRRAGGQSAMECIESAPSGPRPLSSALPRRRRWPPTRRQEPLKRAFVPAPPRPKNPCPHSTHSTRSTHSEATEPPSHQSGRP